MGYISVVESLRISSTTFMQCTAKAIKFAEIAQINDHYAVRGHSRSPIWYQSKAHLGLPIND